MRNDQPDTDASMSGANIDFATLTAEALNEYLDSPDTPGDVLEQIFRSSELKTRLRNPGINSRGWLRILADIGGNPNTPERVLWELVESLTADFMQDSLRTAIAHNPGLTESFLIGLSRHRKPGVRKLVLQNPNVTPEILARMSKDKDRNIVQAVALSRRTSVAVLVELAETFPQEVAGNPATPPDLLEELTHRKNGPYDYWSSVARNPNAYPDTLRRLHRERPDGLCWELSGNPSLPHDMFRVLADRYTPATSELPTPWTPDVDQAERICKRLACNPGAPVELLTEFAHDHRPSVRQAVFTNPNTPHHTYEHLKSDPLMGDARKSRIYSHMANIAEDPSTPTEQLEQLAHVSELDVRRHLGENPATPVHVLEYLADIDEDRAANFRKGLVSAIDAQSHVAANPNTPPATLARIASFGSAAMRYDVANNPSTSPETLAKLTRDRQADVRAAAAAHKDTPVADLKRLASSKATTEDAEMILLGVIRNPNCPGDVLDKLSQNAIWEVRRAARTVRKSVPAAPGPEAECVPQQPSGTFLSYAEVAVEALKLSYVAENHLDNGWTLLGTHPAASSFGKTPHLGAYRSVLSAFMKDQHIEPPGPDDMPALPQLPHDDTDKGGFGEASTTLRAYAEQMRATADRLEVLWACMVEAQIEGVSNSIGHINNVRKVLREGRDGLRGAAQVLDDVADDL